MSATTPRAERDTGFADGGPGWAPLLGLCPLLAVSDDKEACVTGKYFYHKKERAPNPAAHDDALQDQLIEACHKYSGVEFPR